QSAAVRSTAALLFWGGVSMRRRLLVVALLSSVSLVTPLDWAGAQPAAASALTYPLTKREDLIETQFGVKVADPYRWLENDVRTDAGVKAWVDQQNAVTNAFLNTLPGRQELKERLTQLFDYERFAVPEKKGEIGRASCREGGEETQ